MQAALLLERMGLSPADLLATARDRPDMPTFAEYVPVVSVAVTAGTRRAYGSYWNRIVSHWGGRHLDDVTPSEIRQLMTYVKTHVVARRNARRLAASVPSRARSATAGLSPGSLELVPGELVERVGDLALPLVGRVQVDQRRPRLPGRPRRRAR